MEETVTIGEKKITIKALKWRDKKALKKRGFDIENLDAAGDNDELVEAVIKLSVGDTDALDDMDIAQVYELFKKVFSLSFVSKEEAKN